MKFTIDRSKWYRGKGTSGSKLLNNYGQMCCVGQMCRTLGVADAEMLDVATIRGLVYGRTGHLPVQEKVRILISEDTYGKNWVDEVSFIRGYKNELGQFVGAYEINDDYLITDNIREKKLTELFAANGHELVFVDSIAA